MSHSERTFKAIFYIGLIYLGIAIILGLVDVLIYDFIPNSPN